ncbi:MAG: bifunctional 5,10-methylene-tetrahydrofolate dehydrogenase/5,10-methylene-tetrahydrofolate cyclohydrolase [Actinobacteria bacterium]|jgi:methylenetetrahydrofolate dehydrogenase (NADP+)/methenyltetrahydrofolate cyclohydrolase|nr:bifunctional 5,10-methylene-tetrahydrofolate dehydrogenase/5,10-methylene-tetrahydrofolate cyclohydrolase [Actinomycetota bacterium]|tara:strand:- start:913 stop:1752 length:840 start_codon:yes stop_codon:yes gene_type:complete
MEQILYGAPVAKQLDEISLKIFQEVKSNNKTPHMTAITVGDNPASLLYVSRKKEKAEELGVEFNWIKLDKNTSQEKLKELVETESKNTDGLIIQLPLPDHLSSEDVINCIPPDVDVDGLTSYNLGSLFSNEYKLIPATSLAVLELLNFYQIKTEDKAIVIAGRSRLVSSPLAKILSSKSYNANVTVIHSKTSNQKQFITQADIFISAVGSAKLYDSSYFKQGATIIDIGISSVDGKTYGDIDTQNISEVASYRSPFPGGVGPITVSALFFNLSRLVKTN